MNDNIGALWVKEGQKGDFYKGFITLENGERLNILVFKNTYKNNEKQPDFQILKAKEIKKQEEEQDDIIKSTLPF
jgi:hypothetical protein